MSKKLTLLQNLSDEKINRLKNTLLDYAEYLNDMKEGENKEEIKIKEKFIHLVMINQRPNITREDLLDDNFCKKHENKYVQSLYKELHESRGLIPDLYNMTANYLFSSDLDEDEYVILRKCNYSGFEVNWLLNKNRDNLVMFTKNLTITWSDNYTDIQFKTGRKIRLFTLSFSRRLLEITYDDKNGIEKNVKFYF